MKTAIKIRIPVFVLIVLLASACATVEPPYRGKLSDAMEVSSDEYKGARHLKAPESQPTDEEEPAESLEAEIIELTTSLEEPNGEPVSESWEKNFMLSSGFGRGFGDYRDQTSFTIRAGGENTKQLRSEIYLGFEGVSLNSSSPLYPSIDGSLKILFAGVGVKYYFSPYSEMIRPYVSAGAGGAFMFWNYRNGFATADGDVVNVDNLSGFTVSTAAGVEFKPARFMSLVIEVNPKVHLWDERTGRGFDNDEFDPLGLIALTLGASILF